MYNEKASKINYRRFMSTKNVQLRPMRIGMEI